jgi:anti-sigma factor RsiW
MANAASDEHLSEDQIAAYLSRTLSRAAREQVELHLVACPECRREVMAVVEILTPSGRPSTSNCLAYLPGFVALATVLAIVLTARVKSWIRVRETKPGEG